MSHIKLKRSLQTGFSVVELLLVLVVVGGVAAAGWYVLQKQDDMTSNSDVAKTDEAASVQEWGGGGTAVSGTFADADVIEVGDGTYRMYYGIQPEVEGNQLEIYSAISSNGIEWTPEEGVRHILSTFPDVIQLEDDTFRMYFQNAGAIKSATSSDGLEWTDEAGERIDTTNDAGLTMDNVAASTTFQQADGSYVMVYRGTIAEAYDADEPLPNQQTQLFLWATSEDGLAWEKQGIAIDSRNSTYLGHMDGPDLVADDDGNLMLYFWGYKGVYASTFSDGTFEEADLVYDAAKASGNPMNRFPSNIPGDPSVIKIGGVWYMYFGSTGSDSGIHYFVLK